ncbi:MAG: NAD(P)H-binding protein [Planctomycetota bacterium]
MQNELQNQPHPQDLTLVIGGHGKTGRRVIDRLNALGRPVRAGSRSAEVPFDWDAPETWDAALAEVSAIYLTYYPDLTVPGAMEKVGALTERAVAAGVSRIVLLSGRGEAEAQESEKIVAASGVQWTVVRAGWFNQNFSEGAFLDLVMSGTVALPVGDVREPFVDCDDIADVAVAALTEPGHHGKIYEVTGPRLMTFSEAAQTIADAAGIEVQFVDVTPEEFEAGLIAEGVPADFVGLLNYLFNEVLDGRNEYLTDGVQEALGRPARDFADYARQAAADGAWMKEVVS